MAPLRLGKLHFQLNSVIHLLAFLSIDAMENMHFLKYVFLKM
nr:MAG TPA: hypothetical protein [Caudoviricetes sp.]